MSEREREALEAAESAYQNALDGRGRKHARTVAYRAYAAVLVGTTREPSEDTQRLDWLEQWCVSVVYSDDNANWCTSPHEPAGIPFGEGQTVREAIDAARAMDSGVRAVGESPHD